MLATDPISYSRNRIMKTSIDPTLIQLSFGGVTIDGKRKNAALEIDKLLMDVCDELNLISGEVITVELSKCKLLASSNTYGMIYYIPPEVRKNRDVRIAISVDYNDSSISYLGGTSYGSMSNGVESALTKLSNSLNPTIGEASTEVYLEGTNTVRVISNVGTNYTTYTKLTIEIENKSKLMNLHKASYPNFHLICLAYLKSYIYNHKLTISKASIYGGHELSEITNIIDTFSGAEQEYNEYISLKAPKMLMFSDPKKTNSIYRDMV